MKKLVKKRKDWKCYLCREKLGKHYRTILVYDTIKEDFNKFGDYGFCLYEKKVCDECSIDLIPNEKCNRMGISLIRK